MSKAMSSARNSFDLADTPLADLVREAAAQRLPPVEQWHPAHCGDSDMRIARDGSWFHMGRPIRRPELVKLFSTILRREEDGSHVLVTPVEKLAIAVEDLPFLAVELKSEGEGQGRTLAFRLSTGDLVVAGATRPLHLNLAADGRPDPALHVRGHIERPLLARINRPVYYQLADLAIAEQQRQGGEIGLWSGGVFFAFAG